MQSLECDQAIWYLEALFLANTHIVWQFWIKNKSLLVILTTLWKFSWDLTSSMKISFLESLYSMISTTNFMFHILYIHFLSHKNPRFLKFFPEFYFIFLFFFHFLKFIFNWRVIALQYCIGFCCTTTWVNHKYTEISSFSSLPPTSPDPTPSGHHRALSWAPCATQQLPASYLLHTR